MTSERVTQHPVGWADSLNKEVGYVYGDATLLLNLELYRDLILE